MQISVTVVLTGDDVFAYTPDAAAAQVIAALGGNPTTDYCTVVVDHTASGAYGVPPPMPGSAALAGTEVA